MTFRTSSRTLSTCVAALGLIATTTAAAPADAPVDGSSDPLAHTVVHLDQPSPELQPGVDTRAALVHTTAPEPAVVPRTGETITVVYTDATTTYTTPYSGCTQSSTMGAPYRTGNVAEASVRFSLSAGCSGNATVTAALQWSHLGWNSRGHFSFPSLRPGNSVSSAVRSGKTCGAGSGTWRSVGFFGTSSSGNSTSASVSLNCRG